MVLNLVVSDYLAAVDKWLGGPSAQDGALLYKNGDDYNSAGNHGPGW